MNKTWLIPLTVAIAAAVSPARADILDATFSGTVISQSGTTSVVGSPITGEFVYNTITNAYTSFTLGGQSVAPGYGSSASITPDLYSAIYRAQLSPVQQGGTLNSTFLVDLEGLNTWPNNNALALLTNTSALASNLDTTASTFSYTTGNSNGTNIHTVTADLTNIKVAVPEPASLALLSAASMGVVFWRRRRS